VLVSSTQTAHGFSQDGHVGKEKGEGDSEKDQQVFVTYLSWWREVGVVVGGWWRWNLQCDTNSYLTASLKLVKLKLLKMNMK
jgi:hypothetical protein